MDQATWNLIDQEAEKEAEALRKARQHRSAFVHQGHHGQSRKEQMTVEQALFDEELEIHYHTCRYCGRQLGDDVRRREDLDMPVRSFLTQDTDVCRTCQYLHNALIRTCPTLQEHAGACD